MASAPGVSPKTALSVGLKVNAGALPPACRTDYSKQGKVDLENPATTVALLKLNAVVGVKGNVTASDGLSSEPRCRLGDLPR